LRGLAAGEENGGRVGDIVTVRMSGVHFLGNKKIDRVPKAQREKEMLLDTDWLFHGEGPVEQQDEEPRK